jgi:hypothetical protein
MSHLVNTLRRGLLVAVLGLPLVGCTTWDWRGESFPDDQQRLTQGLRSRDDESPGPWSFSTKGRQIEENLGK